MAATRSAAHDAAQATVRRSTAFRPRWTWKTRASVAITGWVVAALVRVVYLTLRVQVVDPDGVLQARRGGRRAILAIWHDTIAVAPLIAWRVERSYRITVMLSWHRDAEIAARAVRRLGIRSVHGSSTRGWLGGLRGLLAAHARGDDIVIVPDGPRGPRHEVKEGIVQLARATGLPVVTVGVVARPAHRAGSWDRMQVPWPFARVAVAMGTPLDVADMDNAGGRAAVQAALERVEATACAVLEPPR